MRKRNTKSAASGRIPMGLENVNFTYIDHKKIDKDVGMYIPVLWMVFLETNGNQHLWRKWRKLWCWKSLCISSFWGIGHFLGHQRFEAHTDIYCIYIYTVYIYILGDGFKYFSFYPKKSHFD